MILATPTDSPEGNRAALRFMDGMCAGVVHHPRRTKEEQAAFEEALLGGYRRWWAEKERKAGRNPDETPAQALIRLTEVKP